MSQQKIIACPACDSLNRVPQQRLSEAPKCGRCGETLFQSQVLTITNQNFQAHIHRSELPVLLDYWAPWCGPCKVMAPILDQAAKSMEPLLRVAKINTDDEQALAGQAAIRGIPTMILYTQGKELGRVSGAMELSRLQQWVNQTLSQQN
ncbi:MAG: thioredoxin TrxC [Gammaproteobacteria bacterium]|nr:thioredoxin TrxC [Gammaproteobacteria bacterium]MDH5728873.1 thioredoxin TrxC [Gammaproteobacteria bacterium]